MAVTAAVNVSSPYFFESTDTFSPLACVTTCTISIPALPGHLVYYRHKFLNGGGGVVVTGPGAGCRDAMSASATSAASIPSTIRTAERTAFFHLGVTANAPPVITIRQSDKYRLLGMRSKTSTQILPSLDTPRNAVLLFS